MRDRFDSAYHAALAALLARPDPEGLRRRGHVLSCEGDPDRRSRWLHPILMAWLQRRFLEADGEEPLAAPRASGRLRILRRTGTA